MTTNFDPYQPATHIAEALGYLLCRQSGVCWLMDKQTFKAIEVPSPDPWKPAKYIIERYAPVLKTSQVA